jgi:hypothetical protein
VLNEKNIWLLFVHFICLMFICTNWINEKQRWSRLQNCKLINSFGYFWSQNIVIYYTTFNLENFFFCECNVYLYSSLNILQFGAILLLIIKYKSIPMLYCSLIFCYFIRQLINFRESIWTFFYLAEIIK